MFLGDIHEVPAVRRDIGAVGVGWVGQTPVTRAVEPYAMKLEFHMIVAGTRGVSDESVLFVDLEDLSDVGVMIGKLRDLPAVEVVEI